ncbi:hypothetical protein [Deinococcus sp.]|uniref:hypothetical protein n=1 Tax=Deinococcus sp. TaxID=47478 RepID=UPI0025FDAD8D|nr:hypothetical protein [Deinococcus sp.]
MSPRRLLPLLLALSAAALAQDVSRLATGSQVLLTYSVIVSEPPTIYREQAKLSDLAGEPVTGWQWLFKPLKIVGQTAAGYTLSDGTSQVQLPKRGLATRTVFPLSQDTETRALANELLGKLVWGNGRLHAPCEIVVGYHADVRFRSARISGVWRVQSGPLSLSPQGGLIGGGMVANAKVSAAPILVAFGQPQGVKAEFATMESYIPFQTADLMALAPQRCTRLSVLYASADDLRRNLSLSAPPAVLPVLYNPDKAEKTLLGQTKAWVLALYGSPNEPGTLSDILKLPHWSYGTGAYDDIQIDFGAAGRVVKAVISRSP